MFFKKYSPAIVCGFGAAVLGLIPILNNAACCLLIPVAAILSLSINKKITHDESPIDIGNAIVFGLLTGVFAALFASVFETILTYVTRTNEFVEALPQMESVIKDLMSEQYTAESFGIFRSIAKEIKATGFSLTYAFIFLAGNLIINSIFGMLGGLLGMSILNRRKS